MTHQFEVRDEITIDATPEQVWAAIATGPGIDSWFMGANEVQGGEGGRTSMSMFGEAMGATITAWDPGRHFAYRGDDAPDGTFMAFEYILEGREGGSTVVRFCHSGLMGDDWETEYAGLQVGDGMYLRKLRVYVEYFTGRTSKYNLFLPGPQVDEHDKVWAAFRDALGAGDKPADGDPGRLNVPGLPATEGVIEFTHHDDFLGLRTADAMFMLIRGLQHAVVVSGHSFSATEDHAATEKAWQAWLAASF